MIKCRDYFDKVNYFKMFQKVFLKRHGEHCGYTLFKTPFSVKHYHLGRTRLILCLTKNMRLILIEEFNIESIHDYLYGCRNIYRSISFSGDTLQRKAYFSNLNTHLKVLNFAGKMELFAYDNDKQNNDEVNEYLGLTVGNKDNLKYEFPLSEFSKMPDGKVKLKFFRSRRIEEDDNCFILEVSKETATNLGNSLIEVANLKIKTKKQ